MTALIIGAWLTAASGNPPDETTLYASQLSTPSGTAIIVQSGPADRKPVVRKQVGPGYSILRQESGENSSTIIQMQGGD